MHYAPWMTQWNGTQLVPKLALIARGTSSVCSLTCRHNTPAGNRLHLLCKCKATAAALSLACSPHALFCFTWPHPAVGVAS